MNIFKLLDAMLPNSILAEADLNTLFRCRITAGLTLMYFLSLLSVAVLLLLFTFLGLIDVWPAIISCFLSSSGYLLQMIYFKKSGRLSVAASITMGVMYFATMGCVTFTGGLDSAVINFLFVIPACAFLMAGSQIGMIWSLVSAVSYIVFWGLHYLQIDLPKLVAEEYFVLLQFFMWMFCWTILVGAVTLYSWILNELNSTINQEREQLYIKATYDEETGAYTRSAFNQHITRQAESEFARGTIKALAFIEFSQHQSELDESNHPDAQDNIEILSALMQKIRNELNDEISLCRYGSNSISLLIEQMDSLEKAEGMIENLYNYLDLVMADYHIEIAIGAVITTGDNKDVYTLNQQARQALHTGKQKDNGLEIQSSGIYKNKDEDILERITRISYQQLTATG